MKRLLTVVVLMISLTGCLGQDEDLKQMMEFRAKLLAGQGCSFDAVITADYQETLYTFQLACRADAEGNLSFVVISPETIAGITGRMDGEGGKLIFDDQALAFEPLADGQLSPVSAPWLMIKILRGGYVTSCTQEEGRLRVAINDGYDSGDLKSDVWFDDACEPRFVEYVWKDRRILSREVSNFKIL